MLATLARPDGSPEEEDVEGTPRQAPGDASPRGAARERVPGLPPAEAAAPHVSELPDVQRPRRRAADRARPVVARIAVDALGGDRGPAEIVAGAVEAAREGVEVVVYGPRTLETYGLELVRTTEAIGMDEKPADAVRSKPNS